MTSKVWIVVMTKAKVKQISNKVVFDVSAGPPSIYHFLVIDDVLTQITVDSFQFEVHATKDFTSSYQ